MDSEKRKVLEAAGWRFGDAADFLEMTDEERQLLDARIEAALAVRRHPVGPTDPTCTYRREDIYGDDGR